MAAGSAPFTIIASLLEDVPEIGRFGKGGYATGFDSTSNAQRPTPDA